MYIDSFVIWYKTLFQRTVYIVGKGNKEHVTEPLGAQLSHAQNPNMFTIWLLTERKTKQITI